LQRPLVHFNTVLCANGLIPHLPFAQLPVLQIPCGLQFPLWQRLTQQRPRRHCAETDAVEPAINVMTANAAIDFFIFMGNPPIVRLDYTSKHFRNELILF